MQVTPQMYGNTQPTIFPSVYVRLDNEHQTKGARSIEKVTLEVTSQTLGQGLLRLHQYQRNTCKGGNGVSRR